jgi:LPS sulfotransferase NodH
MRLLLGKYKKWLRYRYQAGISYCLNFIKPVSSDQVRLVIFAQGRTGSTLLESLICSTGFFRENRELLSPDNGEFLYPLQYISGLSKRRVPENFIFHVKIYHLTRNRKRPIDPAMFLEELYKDGWKIIYLRRKNKVKQVLSSVIAEHRGAYHKFNDTEEEYKITLDCTSFVERVNRRIQDEENERKALANVKYLEIVYEEDLEKSDVHQKTVDKILDYSSLEHRMAQTNHKKVNAQSMKNLISNYDEFVGCLNTQGWQSFLEY